MTVGAPAWDNPMPFHPATEGPVFTGGTAIPEYVTHQDPRTSANLVATQDAQDTPLRLNLRTTLDEVPYNTVMPSDAQDVLRDSIVEPRPAMREEAIKQAANSLKRMLSRVPVVEAVLVECFEDGVDISIIVNNADREHRWQIYEQQLQLLRRYWDLSLEFHLIDRRDSAAEEVVDFEGCDLILHI